MIPQTFFEYLRTGDRTLLEPIIHHNRLDIVSLACLANLILKAVDSPHQAPFADGLDWFGLGTLFRQHCRMREAIHCFMRAAAMRLPEETRLRCHKELSLTCKRNGDWQSAVQLWEEGMGASDDVHHIMFSLEELAKFYEHRRRDLSSAREVCLRALAMLEMKATLSDMDVTRPVEDFEYRLKRIERKIRKKNA